MRHAALSLPFAPESPPRIDRSNPLSLDLQKAWYASHPSWEAVDEVGVAANNVTLIDSLFGRAADFSTATGAIDLGAVAAVSRPITLRVRFISPTAGSASYLLACMPATSGSGWRFEASTTGGGLYPVLTYNGIVNYGASPISIAGFGRQMVTDYVVTMDASTITHYVDGSFNTSSAAASFTSGAAGSTIKLGATSGLAQLLQVEYWGRVLSADEIASLYARPVQMIRAPRRRSKLAAGSGRTASASITDTADTISAAATADVAAATSITDATDTTSAAGAVSIAAAVSVTDATDSITSTSTVSIAAAVSVTDSTDSITSAGTVGFSGVTADAAITDTADTISAAGAVSIAGAASIADAADAIGAAATVALSVAFSVTDSTDSISAAGTTTRSVGGLTAAEIAAAVWAEPLSGPTTGGQILSGMADFLRSRGFLP